MAAVGKKFHNCMKKENREACAKKTKLYLKEKGIAIGNGITRMTKDGSAYVVSGLKNIHKNLVAGVVAGAEKARDHINRAKEKARDHINRAKDHINRAKEKAGEHLNNAKNSLKDFFGMN
jgi:hypothetical protein